MKRLAKILATVPILVVDLLMLVYLLRGPLLESRLRELVEQELAAATGCDVSIGAIEGNWVTEVRVLGVQLRGGPGAFVRRVEDLDLTAHIAPFRLLDGDLSGLRAARAIAKRVELDTAGGFPSEGESEPGEPAATPDLTRLLPEGARVHFRDLAIGTGDAWRSGELSVFLEPGLGRRRLRIEHHHDELGGLEGWFAVEPGQELPAVDGRLRIDDPGGVLAVLGVPPPVSGGRMQLRATADLDRLRFVGRAGLEGLRHRRATLESSSLHIELDRDALILSDASVRLPGLRVATEGLLLPSPFAEETIDPLLASGDAHVVVEDLSPYRDLLPPELLEYLPIRADLHAWLHDGRAHVEGGRIETAGAVVRLGRGSLPLREEGGFRTRELSLAFTVTVPESRVFEIPGLGPLQTEGRISGTFLGSLERPRLQAAVDLGPTRTAGYRGEAVAAAAVTFDGARVVVRGLDARSLAPADVAEGRGSVRGDVTIVLPDATGGLRIEADVLGNVDPRLLADLGVEAEELSDLQPFEIACKGTVTGFDLPVPRADGTLRLEGLRVSGLDPATLTIELRTADERLTVERCELRGPATLDLRGDVVLSGEPVFDLQVTLQRADLALLRSVVPLPGSEGSLGGTLSVRGTPADPQVETELRAELADASLLVAGIWDAERMGPPPSGPLRGRLQARFEAGAARLEAFELSTEGDTALSVTASGIVPYDWEPQAGLVVSEGAAEPVVLVATCSSKGPADVDLPWTCAAKLVVGIDATQAELSGRTGPGSFEIKSSIGAGWRQILAGGDALLGATLAGEGMLETLSLEVLPTALAGLAVIEGKLDGTVSLGGTLAAPEPRLDLVLSEGTLRASRLPRLADLRGELSLRPQTAEVRNLTGMLGASPVTLQATLTHDRPFWEGMEGARIEARLTGDQALLYNTTELKLRGDVDLRIAGTTERMDVTGHVKVTTGRYAKRINFVPGVDMLRGRGGAPVTTALELNLLDPPLGDRIHLDVALGSVRDFEVRTGVLNAGLRPDLRVRGTAASAWLEGTVTSGSGAITMPGSKLYLQSLLVTFPSQDPTNPKINATATGRRHGYRVQVVATGSLFDPQIVLSSSPALPAEEIVVLLTTGTLPEELRRQGVAGQAQLLGSYLAQELAAWYLGGETTEDSESFFDRFSVETGHEISDSGLESILVEFQLTDRVYLQAERDVYEAYNGGVVLRFRFK